MNIHFNIRLFLLMLTFGFASVALTLNLSFNKNEILGSDGEVIKKNLHKKELYIHNFLKSSSTFDSLKSIAKNVEWGQKIISKFQEKDIQLLVFENHRLNFWSGIQVILKTDSSLKSGSTFLTWNNGWYEAIKRVDKSFSVVCLIPIKSNYPFQNQYLQNKFAPDLISANNLDIATINDKNVLDIRNIDNKYLFSVKLKSAVINTFYSRVELLMWILSIIFGLMLANQLCAWVVDKGYVKTAVVLLFCFLSAFRLADLQYGWFVHYFDIDIFNPKYYAANYYFPSMGAFMLNIVAITWFVIFLYNYRFQIKLSNKPISKLFSAIIYILLGVILAVAGFQINDLFYGLVLNSNIVFDVTNVLNLNWLSWLGIVILSLSVLSLYLLIQSLLSIGDTLNLTIKERLIIFCTGVTTVLINRLFFSDFDVFFLLFSLNLLLLGWAYYHGKKRFNLGIFTFVILIFAIITSLKLDRFQSIKEKESRKLLASKLESSVDPNAVLLFLNLEREIQKDNFIKDYFDNPLSNYNSLLTRLQKIYFAGYLSRYELKSYEFNRSDKLLRGESDVDISTFKNLVLSGSVKVSDYFYRINNTFGVQNYFALLPISKNDEKVGTLVVQLTSKGIYDISSIPQLLVNGKIKENLNLSGYSYAYYSSGRLLNQQGKFVYDLINKDFPGKLKDHVFVKRIDNNGKKFSHLIYKPTSQKVIVISKEISSLLTKLASVSFIFLILLSFAFIVFTLRWFWFSFNSKKMRLRDLGNYLILTNRMLYKTRIQVSMVSTVVITLIVSGLITFFNISNQYREQQKEGILDKVNKIAAGFNKQLFQNGVLTYNEQTELAFNTFADLNGADLNLFDVEGNLILSTQPKIYQNDLIAPKMNSLAYLYLNKLQKSVCTTEEMIGKLSFISAYVPLRNNRNEPIAYLGLPYFSNIQDYEDRIGLFVNALINVYALVFVAIGFFAVFVANKITNPLTIIQKSLSQTKIGRKNEPIIWKRKDEIGNLIKEYNKMIAALEISALKLARSERESAWREMAKQVAHEIKNPLTPLKLGVQLLDKSWKENDPNFNIKFEKFTKSFIEQIESLAHIASEFSSFAKMPDTVLEKVNLSEIIQKAIEIYKKSDEHIIAFHDKTSIDTIVKADKDQLMRCFNNLIKNAVEARSELRPGIIQIFVHCANNQIFIEVRDNGIGIPESLKSRIFVPNFTTKSSGTGLGLAFVKQAVENMDGSIRFETENDTGTTFFIKLPLVS